MTDNRSRIFAEFIGPEWEQLQQKVARLQTRLEELGSQLQSLSDAEMQKRQAFLMAVDAIERQQKLTPRTAELRKERKREKREQP